MERQGGPIASGQANGRCTAGAGVAGQHTMLTSTTGRTGVRLTTRLMPSAIRSLSTDTSSVVELNAEPVVRSSGGDAGTMAWIAISSSNSAATAWRAILPSLQTISMLNTLTQAGLISKGLKEAPAHPTYPVISARGNRM